MLAQACRGAQQLPASFLSAMRMSQYARRVSPETIQAGLAAVERADSDVTKHLLLAALCTKLFAEHGVDLVVVGGSAIEFYTEGAYMSGDVDLCVLAAKQRLTLRDRQELMGRLGARGGPRNWEVAGIFVDILGALESEARTQVRRLQTELGPVAIAAAEDLIVERVLVAKYPADYPPAWECARKLVDAGLKCEVEIDWNETLRIAKLPAYKNEADVRQLIESEAKALALRSPYDSAE
jgi:hypothetical protein